MAVSFRSARAWATSTGSSPTIGNPAGNTAGDMLIMVASWKDFSITASMAGGWSEINEFADGSVSQGNGTGSMKVAAWWKEDSGSEPGSHTVTFSGTVNIAGLTSMAFIKDGSETWDTPLSVTAAWPSSSGTTQAASSDVSVIKDGSAVVALTGIRDDSATFAADITDDGSPAVTWNGATAGAPSIHLSTTTNNDMAATADYRLVTTGASNVRLQNTHTLSAAETGAMLWIVLNTTAAGGGAVTRTSMVT